MKKKYKICTIGGDGVGPEVLECAIRLLKILPLKFDFVEASAGYDAYKIFGTPLPDSTIRCCKDSDAILFGAVTTPPNIDGYFSPIVALRKQLNLYANLRPVFSLPIGGIYKDVDLIIVRENTEDLYANIERKIEGGAVTERWITRKASEKIIRFAFELAVKQSRKKVTLVHKANVMRLTDGLFLSIGEEIAKKYPQIIFEDMLVDSCAMRLIKNHQDFDVIVTTNMFGDILSDLVAGLVGGLGVVASANIGEKIALFEPVHGSAPKYTNKNFVNPSAMFFATAMMLKWLGEMKFARNICDSVLTTIESGKRTADLGGKLGTEEFTKEVIANLKIK